jgi:hypothetical protein
MATLLSAIETQARRHLNEQTASFWSSAEVIDIISAGIRDLWRDIVDLKAEHFLTVDNTNVSMAANTATLTGVPSDVHKVVIIEPRDVSNSSTSSGMIFKPEDYNHPNFQMARAVDDVTPANATIYYAISGAGGPVGALTIYVAPQVTSAVLLSFAYVPTLGTFTSASNNPIPGESDNALIAWAVAFARAKERENRGPDPEWLAVYATEKQHLLQSLGLRQTHEPKFVDAFFEQYW